MMMIIRSCIAVAALLLTCGVARADLITNGSFENPSAGSYTIYTNGAVPGWTSNNNELEIGAAGTYGAAVYAGAQIAELNGTTYDTISQTVTGLTIGQRYLLTWAYAGRASGGAQKMTTSFGGTVVGTNTATDATPWVNNSVIVQATATSQVVSFAAINVGGNSGAGNLLDAVTLNAYVPEPGSIALLLSALTGVTVWRQRRRAA